MASTNSVAADGGNPESHQQAKLKQFHSAGRGFWSDVPDADWNDFRWQLKHRVTTLEQLRRLLPTLTPEE
ncbi:MAG TPA: lysine 2,3-aminomutase, partial [Candidatus Limnocylindria bacterium]|nr:lysine 2,3-aminomutase [Candidatus Limnocylindria bacterium]